LCASHKNYLKGKTAMATAVSSDWGAEANEEEKEVTKKV
jgi:hypothetical protein